MRRSWMTLPIALLAAGALLAACSPPPPDETELIIPEVTTSKPASSTSERPRRSTTTAAPVVTTLPPPIDLGAETDLNGWKSATAELALERDTSKQHSGEASFKLTASPEGVAGMNDSPDLILEAAGARCTASVWVSGPPGAEVAISMREYDGKVRAGLGEARLKLLDTEWQQVTAALTVVPGRRIDLNIRIANMPPGGSAWLDDVAEECSEPAPAASTTVAPVFGDPIVVAAGSIACAEGKTTKKCLQAATAKLVAGIQPTRVLPLGNLQYGPATNGLEFAASYGPFDNRASWGDFAAFSSPTLGSREFTGTATAEGYFQYWHGNASEPGPYGVPGDGWYAEDLGTWKIIHLNTERAYQAGGAQEAWLREQLASAGDRCVAIAASRQPFNTAGSGPNRAGALYGAAFVGGADLWLAADANVYERYANQDPNGGADESYGIPIFVVGTGGGRPLGPLAETASNRVAGDGANYGVVRLILRDGAYDWAFVNVAGAEIDSGTASCHGAPPAAAIPSPPTSVAGTESATSVVDASADSTTTAPAPTTTAAPPGT